MKKIGERIKSLRRSRHLTQQQLAEKLGIDQGAVSRWERCHITPSARYRQELEAVLDAPLMEMDRPLLESVNKDLHFSILLDTNLCVLAASEITLAVNGCRSREELIGNSYAPLLDKTWHRLYLWLKESGAFDEGISWAKITMPTPTLHSGYRWMDSLWIPFHLDSGELAYRISSRMLDSIPSESLGRATLEVDNKQRELLIPVQEHKVNQLQEHKVNQLQEQPSLVTKTWSRAM
ncbi:helix-turn-helix domain-containing protein [Marinospirillum insulare]|uniref:HTH cro/C1-type domain-containing protein n=1 Tax=Marinospirillum insulare TaxID=217169 RepID=A0ABQ5ZYZ9_9GAMM|nr:helix-turn-helix transcriptional regulator [Marinospirillum insulare]GLR64721.1 hypothetical protein GCM10007878_21590 [Marinospirillum insulare]